MRNIFGKLLVGLVLLGVSALSTTSISHAQSAQNGQNCGPRDSVVEHLNARYGEVFSGGGLHNASSLFEVWVSEDDGSWTILMTDISGQSCIMAAGTDWNPALASQQVAGVKS